METLPQITLHSAVGIFQIAVGHSWLLIILMADHRIFFLHLLTKICVLIQLIPIGQDPGVSYKGIHSPGRLILGSIERNPGILEKIQGRPDTILGNHIA